MISFYFIPVIKQVVGKVGRCDFCERPTTPIASLGEIALSEWSPSQGLSALLATLNLAEEFDLPDNNSDSRLRSLLASTEQAASINNVNISVGITTGAIFGIAAGAFSGMTMFDRKIVSSLLDRFGFIFLCILIGLVGGVIVGAIIDAFSQRGKVALRKINQANDNYRIDLTKLDELSRSYSHIVQRAVKMVRERAAFGHGVDP